MVILRESMRMCQLQELRRRSAGSRRALSEPSRSISRFNKSSQSGIEPILCPAKARIINWAGRQPPLIWLATLWLGTSAFADSAIDYGLGSRPTSRAYLAMPQNDRQAPPHLLSQTLTFRNTPDLEPAKGLIPYDINVPF